MTYNHRQGEDRPYAEILNRLRTGDQTEEDYQVLEERVRKISDKDLPSKALFIMCTNAKVRQMNENRLDDMDGNEPELQAQVHCAGRPVSKPKLARDGSIFNTPLQYKLRLKVDAQVMLTYNVDVQDSLTNGTIGTVAGFEMTPDGKAVKNILVVFKNPKSGAERRKKNSTRLQHQYRDTHVTPISKIEFRFNLSKNPSSKNDFLTAVQFPLKLAFACTAHKMQGSTVSKPDQLVIDLTSVREAAQAYVMMSRVQTISQLFILNQLPREKIYPSPIAMEELKRLQAVALNETSKVEQRNSLVISLNIRSLSANFDNLKKDKQVRARVIALQETWCLEDQAVQQYQLPGYNLHLVSHGRGKGVATYFLPEFELAGEVNTQNYQICKVSSKNFDVINVYRSKGAETAHFLNDLGKLASGRKPCFLVGDFNINFLKEGQHPIVLKITSCAF